jgi:hypothetical protein
MKNVSNSWEQMKRKETWFDLLKQAVELQKFSANLSIGRMEQLRFNALCIVHSN